MPEALETFRVRNRAREVFAATAGHFGLTVAEMVSPKRNHRYARPRQIAIFLARKLTTQSTTQIGKIAKRDHSTVIHAESRIGGLIEFGDAQTRAAIEAIEASL